MSVTNPGKGGYHSTEDLTVGGVLKCGDVTVSGLMDARQGAAFGPISSKNATDGIRYYGTTDHLTYTLIDQSDVWPFYPNHTIPGAGTILIWETAESLDVYNVRYEVISDSLLGAEIGFLSFELFVGIFIQIPIQLTIDTDIFNPTGEFGADVTVFPARASLLFPVELFDIALPYATPDGKFGLRAARLTYLAPLSTQQLVRDRSVVRSGSSITQGGIKRYWGHAHPQKTVNISRKLGEDLDGTLGGEITLNLGGANNAPLQFSANIGMSNAQRVYLQKQTIGPVNVNTGRMITFEAPPDLHISRPIVIDVIWFHQDATPANYTGKDVVFKVFCSAIDFSALGSSIPIGFLPEAVNQVATPCAGTGIAVKTSIPVYVPFGGAGTFVTIAVARMGLDAADTFDGPGPTGGAADGRITLIELGARYYSWRA